MTQNIEATDLKFQFSLHLQENPGKQDEIMEFYERNTIDVQFQLSYVDVK